MSAVEHATKKDHTETLADRDARLHEWLGGLSPGDIVTVRLNSTDTLTGKVYEAPDARGTSLCVWTTVLRHGNGYPVEPAITPAAPRVSTRRTDWGVRDDATGNVGTSGAYNRRAAEEWLAELTEPSTLMQRERTIYEDDVTEWVEVAIPPGGEVR